MDKFIERDTYNFNNLRWLDTYMIGHKGFIAGGCFKNILTKEKVKDIDIFFESLEDFTKAQMYYEDHPDFRLYYQNNKVVAYKHEDDELHIELVKSVFGKPIDIIKDFDFSITKFAYYKEVEQNLDEDDIITYKIIHHTDFFEHLFFKRLVVNKKLKFPNSTFERMIRYMKYGYVPCKETKMNIINAIKDNKNESDKISESLYDGLD